MLQKEKIRNIETILNAMLLKYVKITCEKLIIIKPTEKSAGFLFHSYIHRISLICDAVLLYKETAYTM